jgi:hypothetical protein
MSFNNLSSTSGGQTNMIHGGFTISTDGTTSSLSGTSLYFMSGGESALLTNFNISGTTSGSGTETLRVSLTLASTTINGVINVVTDPTDPLVEDAFENHPHAGTLIITSGASTLTMEILGSTQVRLSLDSDGNGIDTGYPVDVNWTDIDAAGGGFDIDLGSSGSGTGTVIGTDIHGDSIATATTVALPSTTSGTINSSSDDDYFRVDVSAAGLLTVYTTGSLDTYGYLYDAGGTQLASNDDILPPNYNFSISYSVTPGAYYIRVKELFQDVGPYNLVTEFTP